MWSSSCQLWCGSFPSFMLSPPCCLPDLRPEPAGGAGPSLTDDLLSSATITVSSLSGWMGHLWMPGCGCLAVDVPGLKLSKHKRNAQFPNLDFKALTSVVALMLWAKGLRWVASSLVNQCLEDA
ncbi:hypothetical protein DAPPUDRAFT_116522 [Daphnia pulex]|uniref:Uncharacterized protein n=1 Tax=Daphnia pulex TaxID=6669 RepID=E9HPN2_DAPPU|nr:hypothetical protein DAPPUDRAFT_116522 [Daphnia pulex]|eukprot:EFX66311.1 hypothetical protein DAPPUDRAFT_116522 [Daphnia pulex]